MIVLPMSLTKARNNVGDVGSAGGQGAAAVLHRGWRMMIRYQRSATADNSETSAQAGSPNGPD